jgi:hypothetical protein
MAPTPVRYAHIDLIRAISIVGIVATHLLSLRLGDPLVNNIWNYLHFVVVGLVFCSAYIFAAGNPPGATIKLSLSSFKKRFLRLYIPFLAYVLIHYLLWFLFPNWFHGYGLKKSADFIISSVTLTGGIDFGWLPLLFIQLAIMSPFLLTISRKPKQSRLLFVFLGAWLVITTIFRIPDTYSRTVAWIPWSFILLLGFRYRDLEKHIPTITRDILKKAINISTILWITCYIVLMYLGQSLTLTVHKYPPDLFYFSYGIVLTSIMLFFFPKHLHTSSYSMNIVGFLSRHAYAIFFLHYLVLDLITKAN